MGSTSTAGFIARRIGEANVVTTVTSPLTLLVIGTVLYVTFVLLRDWGGFRRLLLGSVSRHVLQHSPCSVAVVRDAT